MVREWSENVTTFEYHEPFYLHFNYHHIVDDHNNLWHNVPSVKETWVTNRWALCVLQFLMAVTEAPLHAILCLGWELKDDSFGV